MLIDLPTTAGLHDRDARFTPKQILSEGLPRLAMSLLAGDGVRPTAAQARAFAAYARSDDPVADRLVAAMRAGDRAAIRAQFEQALAHGIETVEDPDPAVVEFIAALDDVPFWVDYTKLDVAAAALARMPMSTLMPFTTALAFPASYVSPRVNDVLLRGGDLHKRAAGRIVETVSWIVDCTAPGGMERFGAGTQNTARVRLIHAYIRAGVNSDPEWDAEVSGDPVNQLHYCVTMIPITGIALATMFAGHHYSRTEREAILHLHRYISHVMGVVPELQVTCMDDLLRLIWLAVWSEMDPDESSRRLTGAALDAVPTMYGLTGRGPVGRARRWAVRNVHSDLVRLAFGPDYSDAVGVTGLSPAAALLPLWVARNLALDLPRRLVPGGAARAARRGHAARVRDLAQIKARLTIRAYERDGAQAARPAA